jgi:hypothetical protein
MKSLMKIGILVALVFVLVSNAFATEDVLISPAIWAPDPEPKLRCMINNIHYRQQDVTIEICSADGTCLAFPHSVDPGDVIFEYIDGADGFWYCKFTVPEKHKVKASICSNIGCMAVK